MFSGALWIGGKDSLGDLRVAVSTYRNNEYIDYFPGPLGYNNGITSFDTSNCISYKRIWKFDKSDILNYLNTGETTADMLDYPANGNTAADELPVLSPFYDANNNGIYEPLAGDFPMMDVYNNLSLTTPQLYGDQCLYSIYNDFGDVKTYTGSLPLGVEIHQQSFAFASTNDAVNNTTFYLYRIINRSAMRYDSIYIAHFVDADLGDPFDDFTGCHVIQNMGFNYNGDNDDDVTSGGYGISPPAIGMKILKGPKSIPNDGVDNNNNGIIDEPGEDCRLNYYVNLRKDFTFDGFPQFTQDFFYNMSGRWKNGQRWTRDGKSDIFPFPLYPITNYLYPGTSDPAFPGSDWTEITVNNNPFDKRFLMSSGPITMNPGQEDTIIYAVVWSRSPVGYLASVDSLISDAQVIQDFYENGFKAKNNLNNQEVNVTVYPNPVKNVLSIHISDMNYSSNYRLEFYNLCGQKMKEATVNSKFYDLNVASWAKGIYLLKIVSANFSKTLKVVKQ